VRSAGSTLVASVVEDDHGSRRLLGMSVDVTERKRAEQAMRLQAQIIDQTHDAVISTDMRGVIRTWNRGAERRLRLHQRRGRRKKHQHDGLADQENFLRKQISSAITTGNCRRRS